MTVIRDAISGHLSAEVPRRHDRQNRVFPLFSSKTGLSRPTKQWMTPTAAVAIVRLGRKWFMTVPRQSAVPARFLQGEHANAALVSGVSAAGGAVFRPVRP